MYNALPLPQKVDYGWEMRIFSSIILGTTKFSPCQAREPYINFFPLSSLIGTQQSKLFCGQLALSSALPFNPALSFDNLNSLMFCWIDFSNRALSSGL